MSNKQTPYEQKVTAVKLFLEENIPVKRIASLYNVEQNAVYRWIKKYKKAGGFEVLKRNHGGGPKKKLDEKMEKKLLRILLKPAGKYGFENDLWTLKRVKIVCENKLQIEVSKNLIWRTLKQNDFFYKSVEKSYEQGSKDELKDWLDNKLPLILAECKRKQGMLYFLDESNIKLSNSNGKSWSPKNVRPEVKVSGKRGSISAISAISNSGYLIFDLHDGRINSALVVEFLEKLRMNHPNRHLFIFMDNAPVHTANKIKEYEAKHKKIHIEFIPKYWPKYNPDEFVWNYLKNVEMNVYSAKNKEDLKQKVKHKLDKIASCTKTLKGIFLRCKLAFHL